MRRQKASKVKPEVHVHWRDGPGGGRQGGVLESEVKTRDGILEKRLWIPACPLCSHLSDEEWEARRKEPDVVVLELEYRWRTAPRLDVN